MISIVGLFDNTSSRKNLSSEKDKNIRRAFSKVKDEMDDHLDSINANTNEINSNYEYIRHLEATINKLTERLEEAELKIAEMSGEKKYRKEDFRNIILNPKEKEVFLLLYSRSGDLIDYREIGKSLGLTEELAQKYVSSIISKGIPVEKKHFENKIYLVLDNEFRTIQAKENIINVN